MMGRDDSGEYKVNDVERADKQLIGRLAGGAARVAADLGPELGLWSLRDFLRVANSPEFREKVVRKTGKLSVVKELLRR